MAIKSPLNPGVIARERRVTPEAVQNFISGGSPLGSSVVASAANKIVGFQRGTAGVAPQVPDLGSIINTLSSNILNNVENRVQAITQNVNQIVQKTVGDLQNRFISKTDSIDANAQNKILSNFLSLYDKAIGYIRFFANPNNIKSLNESLVELRKVFDETFKVAKSIRQTIIRIVDQLSNLPTANAGGGGIDLDVKVPGPPLKRAGNTGILRSMRRRPGLMLGGAALAGAGTGAMVTNALQDVGGGVQPQLMGETGEGLSGPLLDKFNAILDRFSAVLKSLSTRPSKQQPGGGSSTSSKTDRSSKTSGQSPGGTVPTATGPADFSGSENAEKAFNYFISQGYSKEQSAGIVGNLMQENRALDPKVRNSINHKGIAQWDPNIRYPGLVKFSKERGLNPETLEAQLQYFENEMVTGSGGLSKKRFLAEAKTVEQAAVLMRKGFFRPGESEARDDNRIMFGKQVLQKYGANLKPGSDGKPGAPGARGLDGKPGTSTQPRVAVVTPAPAQQQMQQQSAQQVAQVPATQSQPQVNILPLQGGGGNQQGTAKPPQAPITGIRGETVPMLPTTNPDNFLTLYSKMVYNIVDG